MGNGSKRWVVAAAGVAVQLLLGTVYAWSVFKKPIMAAHHWTGPQVGLVFTLLIGCLGLSAAFAGGLVDRTGARRVATCGAILFGLGTLLAGLADRLGSLWLFYLLWTVFFINIAAGIALISNLAPMAQAQAGLTAAAAGTVVFVTALFNGLGRIAWASLSDRIGRRAAFVLIFLTQIPAFLLLPRVDNAVAFTALACYVLLCYGGGFGTMPAFAADAFGPRNIGRIYGKILLAWSAAAVAGPMLMEFIKARYDNYNAAMYVAAGLLTVAFALALCYRKPVVLATAPVAAGDSATNQSR